MKYIAAGNSEGHELYQKEQLILASSLLHLQLSLLAQLHVDL